MGKLVHCDAYKLNNDQLLVSRLLCLVQPISYVVISVSEHYGAALAGFVDYDIVVVAHSFDCCMLFPCLRVLKVGNVYFHSMKGILEGFGIQSCFRCSGCGYSSTPEEVWFTVSLGGLGGARDLRYIEFTLCAKWSTHLMSSLFVMFGAVGMNDRPLLSAMIWSLESCILVSLTILSRAHSKQFAFL